ncbi:MAG TPA: hypothetical protein ENK31_08925 [Nannocystis exedens]|nr:hypothetical protein [Nannocystis exedens]
MNDGLDIWQRYDAKVVQVRELEEKVRELEEQAVALAEERDLRASACAVLTRKLTSARLIAERLRHTERGSELQGAEHSALRMRGEFDRARELIGCLVSSLSGAWSAREQAWKADSKSGGRLLYALTRGAMASVSMDSFRVDADWLRKLDLEKLRIELGIDDAGVDLCVEDEDKPAPAPPPARIESLVDLYSSDRELPPPPLFVNGVQHELPPLSTLDPYDEPEFEVEAEPDSEITSVGPAPKRPLPVRSELRTGRKKSTTMQAMPAPHFSIGKLVKPT